MSLFCCLLLMMVCLPMGGDCFKSDLCDSGCADIPSSDLSYQRGMKFTYRFSTTVTTTLQGSNAGRAGLALDCVVDIDVVSKCHLVMQIRNPQIKRLSPLKEHSVQHLKKLRESLEKTRLRFSLQGGKVTALCLQEGEQVWTLNIKRGFLSMIQTSHTSAKQETELETDVYGTCASRYERRGALLLKSRDIKQCQLSRLDHFWPHSVAFTDDSSVQSELLCSQRVGSAVTEEVNCTETVSLVMPSKSSGLLKTQTVSTIKLLRVQPILPSTAESGGFTGLSHLQFEDEGTPQPSKMISHQQAAETARMLCVAATEPQQVSHHFLQLVFQLRDLTLPQLKLLWQEAAFKCRNDWQPLLDALPACGSENCIILLMELLKKKELDESEAKTLLDSIALIPHPSPRMIHLISSLVAVPEFFPTALLSGSSMVHQLCQRSETPCVDLPQVQNLVKTIQDILKSGCDTQEPTRLKELTYAVKSVGNIGGPAESLIPLLNRCVLGNVAPLELRLSSLKAFRRFSCSSDRSVLLQLYGSSQEDPEVRIAAYQQLMRCPNPHVYKAVRTILRDETSSQVGSFVWSHLTNILRSEDPMKRTLTESLPDDIISKDFEAEFMKHSSYSDHTLSSGLGMANIESSVIFSPKSFIPRSASANLTVYFQGRATNLLEVDLRVENAEPLLKSIFGHNSQDGEMSQSKKQEPSRAVMAVQKINEDHACLSSTNRYLNQARTMVSGQDKLKENQLRCSIGVKVFGNELGVFTCEDIYNQINQLSLSTAGLAVKLLKGQEVQLNHRAVLMTDRLVLPSLSGLPIKFAINMTSLLSLHVKGNANYRDTSHFSVTGYIKPSAYLGLSARMGVDGALGQAAVEWMSNLKSSMSLDGSVDLQEGQDIRVTLNTPEDVMDIISFNSQVFQLSGDHREEISGPKTRIQKTSCTPKSLSKIVGWQLCSNASYPLAPAGISLPPSGPVHLSLRLLKLDRGLHYYLLEAAYSLQLQRGSWLPKEASVHFFLATPQSSIPRDMSFDVAFNSQRLLLRVTHPLKTILIQGQVEHEKSFKRAKVEFVIDTFHYYIMALIDSHTVASEQRTRYHLEAKTGSDGSPVILSANVTRGIGGKTSFSATVKNVFRETALVSVSLERRRDSSSKQYSLEAELLFPGVIGSRMLGLMEHKGSLWSSALRLKYGVGVDARQLREECYTTQRVRSESHFNFTSNMRADHEFYCSSTAPINHRVHIRHEESPSHVKSSLDMSYGKHWDEINNKRTLLLSQSFKNQSTDNHTSYTLEFNLQVPEKNLNYRTQLLHSHLRQLGSESSTHLKINYNNMIPLVAGLHWKTPSSEDLQKKWEGTFNMDTPWLYIYTTHVLSQHQHHSLQLTSELTFSKWITLRNLHLEGVFRDRGREKEARLKLYTPTATYIQVEGWGFVGKQHVKSYCSLVSLWTAPLRGEISLETLKFSHTLHMLLSSGKQNASLAAALTTVNKNLKRRQVSLKIALSEPKSRKELELNGTLEELRKDKKMYQKTAVLLFRQPFQTLPPSLVLRQTFTSDLLRGLYILESRAGLYDSREIVHTLTIGYRPPSPFVCSALFHPFSSQTIPPDSEFCVNVSSNLTLKEVQGKLRIGSKEKLNFFGQVQANPLHLQQQMIKVKANMSHQLQLLLPSSAVVEGDIRWKTENKSDFDYQTQGRLKVERNECKVSAQISGSPGKVDLYAFVKHPFKSKLPKTIEAKASADVSPSAGGGKSSVRVKADGKDRALLDAQMSHSLQQGGRSMGLRMNLSQSLLPALTDLYISTMANMTPNSVSLHGSVTHGSKVMLALFKASLNNSTGVHLVVSADLRHPFTSFSIIPSVLSLDGAFDQSHAVMEGQMRVRVMERLYSVELQHQPGEAQSRDQVSDRMARDWICVRSGVEYLCVNVSHQISPKGMREFSTQLSHSFHQLSATGVPTSNTAHVRWDHDGGRLWVTADVQVGTEYLKAGLNGGRASGSSLRWDFVCSLQHQVNSLLKRGISNSSGAKAHCQIYEEGLDTGLQIHVGDEPMVDALFAVGSKNGGVFLAASIWQQMKVLSGVVPNYLQMNCSGDGAADRLSAQCHGNIAGRPVEVRVTRSHRPHKRLCFGFSLSHSSFTAQSRGCVSADGQRELRANISHSSKLLLTHLGLPTESGLSVLFRPGSRRSTLGLSLSLSPWKAHLNLRLRVERDGLYGWHGLLQHGRESLLHRAEMTGRVRMESWCHIWADLGGSWDSLSSTLLLSARCKGVGRLLWNLRRVEEGELVKTALIIHGQVGEGGSKGLVGFDDKLGSLHFSWSLWVKDFKAEVGWSLHHQWAVLESIIPDTVTFQGSGQHNSTSFSAGVQVLFNSHSVLLNATMSLVPSYSAGVKLQQNITDRIPVVLAIRAAASSSQTQMEVDSDTCSLLVNQGRRGGERKRSWIVSVHQQCFLLKTLLPPQMSVNISLSRSSASTDLITAVHLLNEQKGKLLLSLTCHPSRTFRASFQHSIDLLRTLGFLQQGSVMLSVSPSPMLAVNFNLDLGRCYFNGNVENPKSSNAELSRFLYAANLTSYCPALQETVLPVSVVYTGVLSLVPCQLMLTTFLKADSQELSLDLGQSCSRSPHVFGTLKHTFPALRSRGVPQTFTVEVTAPSDPQPTGVLVIKLGSCYFQVDTERDASGRTMWVWRLQSKCPMLQAQLNGSVWHDHQGSWTVKMETNLKGRRGHLTLNAQSRPDFFMEGKVHQNIPFLRGFPESSKITLRSRALEQQYKTEAFIHVDDCVVKAAGAVMLHPGLQGSVLYHNNCTVIQGFGSPDEIQASGSLAVSPAVAKAQVSAVIDGTELHSVVSLKQNKEQNEVHLLFNHTVPLLKRFGVVTNAEITLKSGRHGNQSCYYLLHCCIQKQKFTQEIKMEKTSVTTRVENQLRHSFSSLKKLGLPGNSSVQVEISSSEGNTLNLLSQFGEQKAGLKLRMKSFSSSKEMRGVMWHNLTWLRDQALPSHVQGSCSIQGPLSQLQSGVQVEVDGNKLLISGLNVSLADGRLATLLVFSPRHTIQKHFSSAMTIQFKGPLRSLSVDAQTHEWKSHLVGDVGGWGSRSASKEGRFTLKHMVLGQSSPALQVEAWGRLSASQLRCSVAVNPELTSSLALIIQGQHLPESKDLMVKVVQNIPQILIFIPSQLTLRSQLNQSRSSVGALVELNSGRRRLYMLGELAAIESGYRQTAELKHSYPQLKLLPRTVAVKTVYESRDWSYQVQHGSVFGNQEFTLFGLYSSPPTPQFGNQTIKVQITCVPRLTSLNATLEGSPVGRHDSVSLTWMRHGRQEQVSAVSWWSQSLEVNETRLELKQPFVSAAQQISIHTLSRGSMREQNSNQQTHVSWDSATPGNVSVTLNKQWRLNSSRGQACVLLSSQQMTLSTVKGCVSVGQEGNSYTQNAELSWEDRRIKQGMKYQKAARGMQSIQVNLGFVNLFPHPCHSRTLLAKIRSNLRDRLEHTVFFGLCPPEPTVSWAGTHRVNSGKELFHSQSRLSVTGHPPLCSLTLALINSSTAQRTNVSVFTESRVGNWSVELQGSALSGPVGSGLQLQAILDGKEKMWLNSTVEGKCLQTTAGLKNGMGRSESATALVCVGSTPGLVFDLQKRDGGSEPKGLASLSVETASQRVVVRASGCLDCLTALEARVQVLDTQLRNNMLERMKASLQVVREFQLQASRDGQLLQELFDQAHRQAEALLVSRDGDVMSGWKTSPLRHFLTVTLPRTLGLLQHASMLGQQELKRPLATLAGVYQDVKGQKVEALWREIVSVCREGLTEVLTGLLENPQLKPLAQAGVGALSVALDVAGQHTYQWTDSRIAAALFGVRKQLASVYRFSPRDGSVLVSLPLPPISWSRLAEVGVVELLLEQWILRPLQTLLSIRPAAELYRLKRKIMDSPFLHRAVVVADQFVLTFDGHLHALPSSCPLLLSQDISSDPSFTLVLNSDSQNFLLMEMNNSSISIQNNGQVKVDCNVGTHVSHSDGGISVRRGSNFVEVSNESGASLSCDLTLRVCSWTLNGWLHGKSTGALGTNDNEPGNDLSLPSGPQAENMESFYSAWQLSKGCTRRSAPPEPSPKSAVSPVTCGLLFSSADSPLSSCFKVVHPGQFRRACEKSSPNAACRLAWAFVLLCQQNYVPLNLPPQCGSMDELASSRLNILLSNPWPNNSFLTLNTSTWL